VPTTLPALHQSHTTGANHTSRVAPKSHYRCQPHFPRCSKVTLLVPTTPPALHQNQTTGANHTTGVAPMSHYRKQEQDNWRYRGRAGFLWPSPVQVLSISVFNVLVERFHKARAGIKGTFQNWPQTNQNMRTRKQEKEKHTPGGRKLNRFSPSASFASSSLGSSLFEMSRYKYLRIFSILSNIESFLSAIV
jgi:hypothetical protein